MLDFAPISVSLENAIMRGIGVTLRTRVGSEEVSTNIKQILEHRFSSFTLGHLVL